MQFVLRALSILLITAVAALPATAQTVRGRVLDDAAGDAVAGGFVRLVRSDGAIASSTLTNATGTYQLNALPGVYRLRVERIGFRSYE